MSTEYKNKAISKNMEALRTKDDSKYAISENVVDVTTEEELWEAISVTVVLISSTLHCQGRMSFSPERPSQT